MTLRSILPLTLAGLPLLLTAQVGTLDPTFGTGGVVRADAGRSDVLRDITLQADGRIVGTGWAYDETSTDLLMARFTSDGAPDPTFSGDGHLILPTGAGFSGGEAVRVQPDGKIVVGGYTNNGSTNGFTVWRFNADGTPDNGFGTAGVFTDFSYTDGSFVTDLVLQPDGRILITGPGYDVNSAAVIERLTASGTLDATFNGTGRMQYPTAHPVPAQWTPNAMQLLGDGRIVVAGSTQANGEWDPFILRAAAVGQLDAAFNGNGVRVVDATQRSYVYDLFVRSDGRYVMTGETLFNGSYDVLFVQVDASGANSNFGGTNLWSVNNGANEYCRGAAMQADGRILAAGTSLPFGGGANAYLMRTVANGEGNDVSFGTGGWIIGDFGDWTYVEDMLVQPDGKVLLAGNSASGGAPYDMLLARYDVETTTAIGGTGTAERPVLYPQPNRGTFTVKDTHAGDRLVVRDVQGRTVHIQVASEGSTLVAVQVPAGVYSVDVVSRDARRTVRCVIE